MPVPESIRKVPRPRNTVVVDSGSNGTKRYAVHGRLTSICKPGCNPRPVNGPVIGHIIDGQFVPRNESAKLAAEGPEFLSYGVAALLHEEHRGLDRELFKVYDAKDACMILALAMLRLERPGHPISRCRQHYEKSFVSVFYPGLPLSENTVGNFLKKLGQDSSRMLAFTTSRIASVCQGHHVIIDGTLKQNTSIVNDLSAFSRKARVKGCKEISVLYAYDLEAQEPLCAQIFPGNMIDARAYRSFVRDNKIEKGILITDKGFPPKEIEDLFAQHKDLHFLSPLKRNDRRIAEHAMLDFNDCLRGIEKRVRCKKAQLKNGRFLYSFKDSRKAQAEDNSFMDLQRRNGSYDKAAYDKAKESYGTIVFESDLDLTCAEVYASYEDRWMLEMFFDVYKNSLDFDATRVQSDYSVRGSEFVDLIATIITSRIVKRMSQAGVLDRDTFGNVMDALKGCWRSRKASREELPKVDDQYWNRLLKCDSELLIALKLAAPSESEASAPKKRGRPRKELKPVQTEDETTPKRRPGRPRTRPVIYGPPRPRGRPRKGTSSNGYSGKN